MDLKHFFDAMSDETKHAFDMISILGTLGALVNLLPTLSALASFIWFCLRIYESPTVQRWLGRGDS